jgi:tetratricopeptide (TPR) repeat protein
MRRFVLVLLLLAAIPPASAAAQEPEASVGADTAAYYFLVARRLEDAGKPDEAIATLQRALKLAPSSAEIRAELAAVYARSDRVVEAVTAAEEAVKFDAANAEANRILGNIYAALADQKRPLRPGDDPSTYAARAIAALEKVRTPGGADINTELVLGRLYLRSGKPQQAVTALRNVFEQQPQYSEGALLLAAAHEASGNLAEATSTLETAVQINPGFFRVYPRLIDFYERQRRWKDAARAYAMAREVNPKADLVNGHALALMNAGDLKEAQALLQQAMAGQTAPNAGLLYLFAESQRRQKDFTGAIATLQKLRAAFPDRPAFGYMHAQVLEESGQLAEAEKELRGLLAKDPNDANALNSLGYLFAERGERLDEAVTLLQRALKVDPGNPSYLDSLGWAFFKQGRLELADAPLSEAAEKSPENSVIHDHLGDLRFRQQRFAEAVVAWERALSGDGESVDRALIEKKLRDARARVAKK